MAPSTRMSVSATKKVSFSKNRKKGWKRHSDVADIEEYLEDKRKDEILGGPVSEKASENLFYIENKPVKKLESSAQRKLKKRNALQHLRCFKSLENDSKIEPPVKPPNINQRFKIRTRPPHPLKLAKLLKRQQIVDNNRMKMINENERIRAKHLETGTYDLWDPQDAPYDEKPEPSIGDEKLDDYYKEQTRKKKYKVPISRSIKPSALSAVEVPHPGASYNPAHDDHQRLLRQAVEVEEKKIKQANKIKRALRDLFPKSGQVPNQDEWLREMSQGLVEDGRSDNEGEIDYLAPLTLNPAIRADNRKSAKKRRRQARHEKLLDEAKKRKEIVKRDKQVARLGVLNSEIEKMSARHEERTRQRRIKRLQKASQPCRLSKYKYEAPDMEVTLSHELRGSFRLMKMEGSLFNDRYKSFQRRNIIETKATKSTHKIKMKKVQLKKYMRKGFAEADAYFG